MTRLAPLALILLLCTCNLERVEDPTGNCANPPTAAFTPDRLSGNAPLTVAFNNTSAGAATYLWTFSLGATSTQVSPSHTFTAAGNYTVTLVASSTSGCKDTAMVSIVVNPSGPVPVAGFSITNAGCFAPCDVVFTNSSTNATSFEWDFGDGTPIVTQINPTHKYALPGDYLVTLNAAGPGGTNSIIKPVQVNTLTFTKTFGGANQDWGSSVQQTADGGYILLGSTRSEGAGDLDMYLVKTDNAGNLTWKKTFGGTGYDESFSVQQTTDGGYILLGYTESEGAGGGDMYLIKTNNAGNLIWKKTFGGAGYEEGRSVQQAADGGYILLGVTNSEGAGSLDVYLIKTDNLGNLTWKRTFGGTNSDTGISVRQTADGGYILLGTTRSEGAGESDMYLVKTDNMGNLTWKRTFGGAVFDAGLSVQQTADGGYVLLGYTNSEGAGGFDMYLVKTDNAGNLTWKRTYGGAGVDVGFSVQQTADGGYILLGATQSEGAGGDDMYLVKTDNTGNLTWKRTFGGANGDGGYSVQQTSDGGYILLGQTASSGAGQIDFYLVKTDKDGNL